MSHHARRDQLAAVKLVDVCGRLPLHDISEPLTGCRPRRSTLAKYHHEEYALGFARRHGRLPFVTFENS